jgi:hypothetical protein
MIVRRGVRGVVAKRIFDPSLGVVEICVENDKEIRKIIVDIWDMYATAYPPATTQAIVSRAAKSGLGSPEHSSSTKAAVR